MPEIPYCEACYIPARTYAEGIPSVPAHKLPADFRMTVTSVGSAEVLDEINVCRACAAEPLDALQLTVPDAK